MSWRRKKEKNEKLWNSLTREKKRGLEKAIKIKSLQSHKFNMSLKRQKELSKLNFSILTAYIMEKKYGTEKKWQIWKQRNKEKAIVSFVHMRFDQLNYTSKSWILCCCFFFIPDEMEEEWWKYNGWKRITFAVTEVRRWEEHFFCFERRPIRSVEVSDKVVGSIYWIWLREIKEEKIAKR